MLARYSGQLCTLRFSCTLFEFTDEAAEAEPKTESRTEDHQSKASVAITIVFEIQTGEKEDDTN